MTVTEKLFKKQLRDERNAETAGNEMIKRLMENTMTK